MVNPLDDGEDASDIKPSVSPVEEPTSTDIPPMSNSGSTSGYQSSPSPAFHLGSMPTSSSSQTTPPRSSSASPDGCLPDSTTLSSPPYTMGALPKVASVDGVSVSDLGYHSGSGTSMSSSMFSPNLASISPREPDTSIGGANLDIFSPMPGQQLSPENPPSVFSPESIRSVSPSHQTLHTTTPNSIPPMMTQQPYSSAQTPFQDSISSSNAYSNSANFEFQETKYRPGVHHHQCAFSIPNEPHKGLQQHQNANSQGWNSQALPRFIKQEPPEFGYRVQQQAQPSSFVPQFRPSQMPFGAPMREAIVSSSVIIIDDSPSSSNPGQLSSLPVLTGEDLSVLDVIEQLDGGPSLRQTPQYNPYMTQAPYSST